MIFSDKPQTIFSVAREEPTSLSATGPLLLGDELVRPTEEDLGAQVPAQFVTGRLFPRWWGPRRNSELRLFLYGSWIVSN
jgi:hypothetical protein